MSAESPSLASWFPILRDLPVKTPTTKWIELSDEEHSQLWGVLDGKRTLIRSIASSLQRMASDAPEVSYPLFLRTGQGSGKHHWSTTCHVDRAREMEAHIAKLVEWSAVVDPMGLPIDVWAIREMLPVRSIGTIFDGLPLVPEIRVFLRDRQVVCAHDYWPLGALRQGGATQEQIDMYRLKQKTVRHRMERWRAYSEVVANAFPGFWSLDWLWTERGWYAIDMAPGARSYHAEGCKEDSERITEGERALAGESDT